jgi:hypothetical protein
VTSLNQGANHQLYCVLVGNLRYPRPLISDTLRSLLADVLPDAGHLGGMVISTKASPGVYSVKVTQDLRGLAMLVKSGGNAVWTQFLGTADPKQALQHAIGNPEDGAPNPASETILYNTIWPHAHPRRRHRIDDVTM